MFDNCSHAFIIQVFNKIISDNINEINLNIIENNNKFTLLKFLTALNSLGINIKEARIEAKAQKPELYNKYLEILKRKNEKFDFKNINIYKDPFNSKELVSLNQSVIIDKIYTNIIRAQNGEGVRDIFVTAPTGAGKSILFQIPAIMAAEQNGLITIVISPLIALMNDQIVNIQCMTKCAATINSDYTPFEKERTKEKIKNGEISILYISPETLLSNSDITTFIGDRKIGLLVIDEAHTVATWGKNFRPDYWYLGDYLDALRHRNRFSFPIATFTATATISDGADDMYHDIIESLNMTVDTPFIGDVKRSNIAFDINVCKKDHAYEEEKDKVVLERLNNYINGKEKTIVYFPYVSKLNEIANCLSSHKIGRYYGNLDKSEKEETLQNITSGEINTVLATKAFGMGIDVEDIKNIYHFAPTGNLADYVQEIGRAARKNSMIGIACTDYYEEDFRYINKLYGMSQITDYNIVGVLNKILYKYRSCGKRNFMIATEEFAHIFSAKDDQEIESKLKATMLAIKKDFARTSNYVPLIFKPRSMFTNGIFYIPDSKMAYVKSIGLDKYLTIKYNRAELKKMNGKSITVSYLGDVYTFNFKKCWEEKYNSFENGMSFGMFKRAFFEIDDNNINQLNIDKSAFVDKMVLTIKAKYDNCFYNVISKSEWFLSKLKETLDDIKVANKHFTIKELATKLGTKLNNGMKQQKLEGIVDPLLNLFMDYDSNVHFGKYKFCAYNSVTDKYHIVSSFYNRIIDNIKKEIKSHFDSFENDVERVSLIDFSKDKNRKMRNNILLVSSQILEMLDLISYTFQNGDRPEFFIRVNSEKAIEKVLEKNNYSSPTLNSIRNLHYDSVKYMRHFFEDLNTDESRWDFIEDYFLGRIDSDKIKKDVITKVKSLDVAKEKADNLAKKATVYNSLVNVYTVYEPEDDCTVQYYISDRQLEVVSGGQKISDGCVLANNLQKSKVGDEFEINKYKYVVKKIETFEI